MTNSVEPQTTRQADLAEKCRKIARMIFENHTNRQIAQELNVSMPTVRNLRQDPMVRTFLNTLHEDLENEAKAVQRTLQETATHAAKLLHAVVTDESANIQLRVAVARDIITKAGLDAPQKVQATVGVGVLSGEALEFLRKPKPFEFSGSGASAQITPEAADAAEAEAPEVPQ